MDVNEPLKRLTNPSNLVDRLEDAEAEAGAGVSAYSEQASMAAESSGDLIVDNLIAPAPGVEVMDVTSTDFTGSFMSGEGATFGSETYNFGGVNAGVLQAGVKQSDGSILAGGGVVMMNEDGISVVVGASTADINSYKLVDSLGNLIGRLSGNDNTDVAPAIVLEGEDVKLELRAGTAGVWLFGDAGINVQDDITLRGKVITPKTSNLTIASDAITVTGMYHRVDTESSAATDNLATINGGEDGQLLILATVNSTRDVTLNETGNIRLGSGTTRVLDNINDRIVLINDGTNWVELSFADNN